MCGAGSLPARMAEHARRQGWRVVAFAFDGAPDLGDRVARVVPARVTDLPAVVGGLLAEHVDAVLLSGRFSMAEFLRAPAVEGEQARLEATVGAFVDTRMAEVMATTLSGMGIELLDQRPFLGEWLAPPGTWSAREPGELEWPDIRRGLVVARLAANAGVGQTVVVKRGAVTAVEAVEGTTAAIARGATLGGPGAVVVKVAANGHDFRFDTPAIGPDTLEAAAAGGVTALAVEAGRVLLLDREAMVGRADAAGIALVSVHAPGG
jgi:UDP-2,3-diacylglucosamine hydrolase